LKALVCIQQIIPLDTSLFEQDKVKTLQSIKIEPSITEEGKGYSLQNSREKEKEEKEDNRNRKYRRTLLNSRDKGKEKETEYEGEKGQSDPKCFTI
jgi:hypothetical protein